MAIICGLLKRDELLQVSSITDKFSSEVLKRLPEKQHLNITAGRLTSILKDIQSLQMAVKRCDVLAPIFLAAAMNPHGVQARNLAANHVQIPEKFVQMAAEKHELLKHRPVVHRGTL